MNREPILAALFAKLSGVPGVATASRVVRHFSDVAPIEQPALFLSPAFQDAQRSRGLPTKWTIRVDVYLYINRLTSEIPDTVMNGILDAIEAALTPPQAAEVMTLGGLCEHCWIEGSISIDVGAMGNQILCEIPIHILVTK